MPPQVIGRRRGGAADEFFRSTGDDLDHDLVRIARDRVEPEEHAAAVGVELTLHQHRHREWRLAGGRGARRRQDGPHRIEERLPPGDVEHRRELPGHRRLADVLDGRRRADDQGLPVFVGQAHPGVAQHVDDRRIEMGTVPTHRCRGERTSGEGEPGQDRHPADGRPSQVGGLGAGQLRVERPWIVEPDHVGNWRSDGLVPSAPARCGLGLVGHRRRGSASANSVESFHERTAARSVEPKVQRRRTEPARPCARDVVLYSFLLPVR